ncbi:unnamed protein product [Porites evermanni]|uniref:receptor protein-tyrosine kinase n=1 Tax=Porites evermanni TaxID=104178 RepID=A0ABN8SFG1_9CNID|nr:unnamed protein product [Porites evermanni]
MSLFWNSQTTFLLFMAFSVFIKANGLAFVSGPDKITINATTGSNQKFTWELNISQEHKERKLTAHFGTWNGIYKLVKPILITFNQDPSGNTTVNKSSKRLYWVGDLKRGYYIAFQLVNIQRDDAGDYGVKLRVDNYPYAPLTLKSWFTLKVEDPPPTPSVDTRHITLNVKDGDPVNITCRTSMESSPSVVWFKDKVPIYTGHSKFLFLANVNRSQAGNYVCVSTSPSGNTSSPVTTVDVLYAPRIVYASKRLKGSLITLKCEANGNPSPTFSWRNKNERIYKGFNTSWNSSSLIVTQRNDVTLYVCTATNKIGWDSYAFSLHEKDTEDSSLFTYISISVVLAIVLVCAIVIQRCVVKRHKERKKGDATDRINTHSSLEVAPTEALYSEIDSLLFGDIEWEIPRSNLKVEKEIGNGSFGVVSRGLAFNLPGKPEWTVVAVKSIKEGASERERRDLLSEMSLLKHLDPHPHVIRLYGCVTTEERPLAVVEYAQFGDLLGYLRKSRGMRDNYYSDPSIKPITSLTSKQLLKFAWEISDGMEYLSMKKIIHRDLAARNVLVGEGEVCKITDFGMARDVQEEDIYVRTHEGRLPIKWTAPEALIGSGAYTTASDVWSFGVVLYEIFTVGGDPFPGVYMKDMIVLLKNGYRMSRPRFISQTLYDMMMECWKSDPSYRPSFGCLSSQLQTMMTEEEQEYVNLAELFYENVQQANC